MDIKGWKHDNSVTTPNFLDIQANIFIIRIYLGY